MRLGVDHLADALRRVSGPATGQAPEKAARLVADVDLDRAARRPRRRAGRDEPDLPRRRDLVPRADLRRPPQLPGRDPGAARRGVRVAASTPRWTPSTRASAAPSSSGTSSTGPRPGSASAPTPTASSPAAAPSPTCRACSSPATGRWPAGPPASSAGCGSSPPPTGTSASRRPPACSASATPRSSRSRPTPTAGWTSARSARRSPRPWPTGWSRWRSSPPPAPPTSARSTRCAPIAELCHLHDTWLHVDAAYGGGLLVSHRLRHRLAGIERADSVTVDYHKTWFQPVSSSALIVRDGSHLGHVTWHADYLNPKDAAHPNQVDKSLQTTRRFDALKLWLTLRIMGPDQIGEYVDTRGRPGRRRCTRTSTRDPDIEVAAAPSLSTIVFRYRPTAWPRTSPTPLTARIRPTLYERGAAMVAATKVDGRCWLKLTLLNPIATLDDILGDHRRAWSAIGRELRRGEAVAADARLRRHRPRPVQPRPGLPDRPDRRPRRRLPRGPRRARLAPRDAARRRHPPGAVPGRPGDDGRPDLALLVPQLPQGDRQPLPVLHPRVASTRCAGSTTTTAAGPPTGSTASASARPSTSVEHARTARARRTSSPPATGEEFRGRRLVLGTGTSPHVPEALEGMGIHSARLPRTTRQRLQRARLDHRRRQRAERGGDLPRPARGEPGPRLPADLADPQPAVLPDGVHQAHPRDDLAGVHVVLPGPARPHPRPAAARAALALQGHQRRPGRRRSSTCTTSCGSTATARTPRWSPTPR